VIQKPPFIRKIHDLRAARHQCTPLAGGQFRYSAPPGLHDDLVLALAIAWRGLGRARKRAVVANAFKDLWDANAAMSTGSAYVMEGVESASSDRVRVLRQHWQN
jgi:hypothetical protein